MTGTAPAPRRDALLAAKLRALVRTRWPAAAEAGASTWPAGAGLVTEGTAWVLAEDEPCRSLGPAVAWALRERAERIHLLASGCSGVLARRATRMRLAIEVWEIESTALRAAEPEPLPREILPPPSTESLRTLIERAGAEVVVEEGIVRGEVLGLEVARVEVGPDGEPQLAIGVGKHDREAHRELLGASQGLDELFRVVRTVAEHRMPGREGHAAYHLSSARWLRALVVRKPAAIGMAALAAVPSPVRRDDLRRQAPAPAAGKALDGSDALVVCSVGIDPDLVPAALDAWLRDARRPRIVLCVPEGDDVRVTRELAALADPPAQVTTVPADWRSALT